MTHYENETDHAVLSEREQEVLTFVGRGLTNQEIADQLFLSRRTIDFHLHNIYHKLHVVNRIQACRVAAASDLIQHGPATWY